MRTGVLNKPHYDEKGFDSWIADDGHRLFAIFDGMGTSEGARGAALLAANLFNQKRSTGMDALEMGATIDEASKAIAVHFPTDGTTAVVTRIDSEGNLHWASIGDSRLYVMHETRVKQITTDEGVGNRLLNYCGPYTKGCCQLGMLEPDQWDAFMICSDGITGDWKEQLLSDVDIERVLLDYPPQDACHKLYQISKKDDDKTVIVVEK